MAGRKIPHVYMILASRHAFIEDFQLPRLITREYTLCQAHAARFYPNVQVLRLKVEGLSMTEKEELFGTSKRNLQIIPAVGFLQQQCLSSNVSNHGSDYHIMNMAIPCSGRPTRPTLLIPSSKKLTSTSNEHKQMDRSKPP